MNVTKKMKAPSDKMLFWIILIFLISYFLMVLSVLNLSYTWFVYDVNYFIEHNRIIV